MNAILKSLAVTALCLAPAVAIAMPGMGSGGGKDRFAAMDLDGSGAVSAEEFQKAFPNMNEGAFAAIDKDGNGSITAEEWGGFMKDHSKAAAAHPKAEGAAAGAGCPALPGAGGKAPAMPLVTPPAQQ